MYGMSFCDFSISDVYVYVINVKYCTLVRLYVIATFLHIALLKGTVSLSPFEGSAQFSKTNFCSKDFVPEATGYSKSCNQTHRSRICIFIPGNILVVVFSVRHCVVW